jgi:predicted hotdog family 3-hydroxylacyl-ACP dehydratase
MSTFACIGVEQTHLDAAWIAARIPHHGSMCLLDGVVSWSETDIYCRATSHGDPANPLRSSGRLGMVNGIEYAAQAMAVHGALLAGREDAPRAGFLTSVREVVFHAERLDGPVDLNIHAKLLSGDGRIKLYQFDLLVAGVSIISGRASVMTEVNLD